MSDHPVDRRFTDARRFLEDHGADDLDHPGGTLLAHLRRTAALLESWGAPADLTLAGLCHAAYGTDGFSPSLVPWTERDVLRALIGEAAEAIVYFYAACDRHFFYAQLVETAEPVFRDRLTGTEQRPTDGEVRDFMELTFANELDIMAVNPAIAAEYGPSVVELFARCQAWVSPVAFEHFRRQLVASSP